jgi:hypothetical protein
VSESRSWRYPIFCNGRGSLEGYDEFRLNFAGISDDGSERDFDVEFKAGRDYSTILWIISPNPEGRRSVRAGLVRGRNVDVNGDGHNRLIDSGSGDWVNFEYLKFLSMCAGFTQASRLGRECQLI